MTWSSTCYFIAIDSEGWDFVNNCDVTSFEVSNDAVLILSFLCTNPGYLFWRWDRFRILVPLVKPMKGAASVSPQRQFIYASDNVDNMSFFPWSIVPSFPASPFSRMTIPLFLVLLLWNFHFKPISQRLRFNLWNKTTASLIKNTLRRRREFSLSIDIWLVCQQCYLDDVVQRSPSTTLANARKVSHLFEVKYWIKSDFKCTGCKGKFENPRLKESTKRLSVSFCVATVEPNVEKTENTFSAWDKVKWMDYVI